MRAVLLLLLCYMCVAENNGSFTLNLLTDYVNAPFNARCLDGSPPGYYYRPGVGEQANSWILFFQGGGWCYTGLNAPKNDGCVARSTSPTGTSLNWAPTVEPGRLEGGGGFLSGEDAIAKGFANFTVVYLNYCDGGSFTGNLDTTVESNGTTLHFRGKANLDAVVHDIREKYGFKEAKEVVVSGCSAGGMACYLHVDYIADEVAPVPTRGVCDAGMFLDVENIVGEGDIMWQRFSNVVDIMNSTLPRRCVEALAPNSSRCIFSQNALQHLVTPTFMIQSLNNFMSWDELTTITNYTIPDSWTNCIPHLMGLTPTSYLNCTAEQKQAILEYHNTLLAVTHTAVDPSTPHGVFGDACPGDHCQTSSGWSTRLVGGVIMSDAVNDWYFKGAQMKLVDPPFPSNPTC